VASVFIASNTITTLFLCGGMSEGMKCGACSQLRRLGYSSVNVQMRRWTLVFTCFRIIAKSDSLLLRVSLSVRVRQLGSHWTDFSWNLIFKLFSENPLKIFKFYSNLTNNESLTWRHVIISPWILVIMRNVSDKICGENQNTYFMFNDFPSRKSCRLWDRVEKCSSLQPVRSQVTV